MLQLQLQLQTLTQRAQLLEQDNAKQTQQCMCPSFSIDAAQWFSSGSSIRPQRKGTTDQSTH